MMKPKHRSLIVAAVSLSILFSNSSSRAGSYEGGKPSPERDLDAMVKAIKGELDPGRAVINGVVIDVKQENPETILGREYLVSRVRVRVDAFDLIEGKEGEFPEKDRLKIIKDTEIEVHSISEGKREFQNNERYIFVVSKNEKNQISVILRTRWNDKYFEFFRQKNNAPAVRK